MNALEEDDVIAKPAPPHTYFGIARAIVPAVQTLRAGEISGIPLALLCAHATECLLKAHLSRAGSDRRLKSSSLRHDLVKLWELAAQEGLALGNPPPSWVVRLGDLHRSPYHLRYSAGVHGLILPNPQELGDGEVDLERLVGAAL